MKRVVLATLGLILGTAGAAKAECPCWVPGDGLGGIDFEAQEFSSPLCALGPAGAVVSAFRDSDSDEDPWAAQATDSCVLVDQANEIEANVENLSSEQSAACLQTLLESQMWLLSCGVPDSDGDGIPNYQECGDISGDGFVNTIDARLIQRCAVGEDLPGVCENPLCDCTGEGACNTIDARLVQRFAVGELTKDDLHCEAKEGVPLETAAPACGLGTELALVLPPLMWLWRRRMS